MAPSCRSSSVDLPLVRAVERVVTWDLHRWTGSGSSASSTLINATSAPTGAGTCQDPYESVLILDHHDIDVEFKWTVEVGTISI